MAVDWVEWWKLFSGVLISAAGLFFLTACELDSKPLKNPELACQMISCVCKAPTMADDDLYSPAQSILLAPGFFHGDPWGA